MNDDKRIKQVIAMRHDLKLRRGKQIAQGAHASMSFICRRLQEAGSVSLGDEMIRSFNALLFGGPGPATRTGRDSGFAPPPPGVPRPFEVQEAYHDRQRTAGVRARSRRQVGHDVT